MKKALLIFVGLIAAGLLLTSGVSLVRQRSTPLVTPTPTTPTVTVVIDTGETIATTSAVSATTAFDALKQAAQANNLAVKTKQYDFGVFVEQIGELPNTKEKSWIYFVNGSAGTVAADKQSVVSGDTVEWRYTKPTIE